MTYDLLPAQKEYYAGAFLGCSSQYNLGFLLRFDKVIPYEKMRDAALRVYAQNDIFRLCFNSEKKQYFDTDVLWDVRKKTFGSEAEVREYIAKDLNEPFDVFSVPFEITAFYYPNYCGFYFKNSHLRFDGVCVPLLTKQFVTLLGVEEGDFETGSFENYLAQYPSYRASERYKADRAFWEKKTKVLQEVSMLSRKAADDVRKFRFTLDKKTLTVINRYCKRTENSVATFFYALAAAFYQRITGQNVLSFGIPVVNRVTKEEWRTLGLYMHILPLIVKTERDNFDTVIDKVADGMMDLFRHQRFTQDDIRSEFPQLSKESAMFDVSIDYMPATDTKGYEVEIQYPNAISLPLEFHFFDKKDTVSCVFRVRHGAYDPYIEDQLDKLFLRFIGAVLKDTSQDTSMIDLYETSDVEEAKERLTGDKINLPSDTTIISAMEKTAQSNPQAVCLIDGEKRITYAEFVEKYSIIDVSIRQLTENKKQTIGILFDRSEEMYETIYAILRGGNSYLPILPEWPQNRIESVLQSSKVSLVIGQKRFASKVVGCDFLAIDGIDFSNKKTAYSPSCLPDDLAYVIYTSGSTGVPNGVEIKHASAVNRILWMQSSYGTKTDVILQKTPYTFDVSVWEIFWMAFCPSTLVVMAPGQHALPKSIVDTVFSEKVTHIHFVPSVFRLFLNYLERFPKEVKRLKTLRHLFLSGEAIDAASNNRFYSLFSGEKVRLHNLYGPTECTIDVSYYDCEEKEEDPIPIGRPIWNTDLFVVDKYGYPVPKGVRGELCVGGVSLAKGYRNNEELTNRRFFESPFIGRRIYKTGDWAMLGEKGLVFCGRMDGQIKISGQRFDVAEVERLMNCRDDITSSAFVFCEKGSEKQPVVYYVGAPEENELRTYLTNDLSFDVLPFPVIKLSQMPVGENGKTDTVKLKTMFAERLLRGEEPVDKLERDICECFKSVLGLDIVYRDTDFFAMGGKSLHVYEMLSLHSLFEGITATTFIKNPTPKALAACIRKNEVFRPLQPIIEETGDKNAVVMFPFAAGDAAAFFELAKTIRSVRPDTSVYFADTSEPDSLSKIIEDSEKLVGKKKTIFYSHCVGCAPAITVIEALKKKDLFVGALVAAAHIPSKRGIKSPWRFCPDGILKKILIRAGVPERAVTAELIERFRRQTDRYFVTAKTLPKTDCPTVVVVSRNDIFTRAAKKAATRWEDYAANLDEVVILENKTHYFQTEEATLIAKIISKYMEEKQC